jgi:two-component system nitrate/nitrite response regulator NarL
VRDRLSALVADDHAPTRAGVRDALDGGDFEVVAEVATAEAAVEAALREQPDVCLLDIHMPGNGIAAAGEIAERLPTSRIVMLTASRDDADLFAALKAGASGYLLKYWQARPPCRARSWRGCSTSSARRSAARRCRSSSAAASS